jgi:hypothetical protein
MDFIRSILTWGWPVVGGAATWLAVEFTAKPYVRFRTLRAAVQAQLLALETTLFSLVSVYRLDRAGLIKVYNAEIERVAQTLRETGVALITMADTEKLLVKLLTVMGYDLRTAGTSLLVFPLMLGQRQDSKGLAPPFDEKLDEIIAVMRSTLRLPKLKLLDSTDDRHAQ